jgi:hypothetical protein
MLTLGIVNLYLQLIRIRDMRTPYKILIEKLEGIPSRKCEDDIKIDDKEF